MRKLLVVIASVLVGVVLGASIPAEAARFGTAAGQAIGALNALYCQLAGCTMVGSVTFSGVTTDITTAGSETLTIDPGSTGAIAITGDTTITGAAVITSTTDQQGVLSNSTGVLAVSDTVNVTAPAISGAETIMKFAVSDDSASYWELVNGTGDNSKFVGTFKSTQASSASDNDSPMNFYAWTVAANDTTNSPMFTLDVRRSDTAAAITARSAFAVYNLANNLFTVNYDGQLFLKSDTGALGSTACDAAGEEGRMVYRGLSTTVSCLCICAQSGASTWGWAAISLAGVCVGATDC